MNEGHVLAYIQFPALQESAHHLTLISINFLKVLHMKYFFILNGNYVVFWNLIQKFSTLFLDKTLSE